MNISNEELTGSNGLAITPSSVFIDGLMGGVLTPRVIERLRRSGLCAINLTAVRIGATLDEALSDLTAVREIIDRNGEQLQLVTSGDDICRASATGRVGIKLRDGSQMNHLPAISTDYTF